MKNRPTKSKQRRTWYLNTIDRGTIEFDTPPNIRAMTFGQLSWSQIQPDLASITQAASAMTLGHLLYCQVSLRFGGRRPPFGGWNCFRSQLRLFLAGLARGRRRRNRD
jgi:hypothetical protein